VLHVEDTFILLRYWNIRGGSSTGSRGAPAPLDPKSQWSPSLGPSFIFLRRNNKEEGEEEERKREEEEISPFFSYF